MQALDRAKRVQAVLTKLVERRERMVQRAASEFRLDLLAAIDQVDDETLGLVQRGLAMDRCEQGLQYAVQLAVDERNEARRVSTRRSGDVPRLPPLPTVFADPHEAPTDSPPAPSSFDLGDEDDLSGLDTPLPPVPGYYSPSAGEQPVRVEQSGSVTVQLEDGQTLDVPVEKLRYPEPGEAALTLADGTVVAAP